MSQLSSGVNSNLNPLAKPFVPGSASFYYFQVTREGNLEGIKAAGLQPKYGGSSNGMSALRMKAEAANSKLSEDFLEESKNKVHLTQKWETVERYASHRLALAQKVHKSSVPIDEMPVVLRCHLLGTVALTPDAHDSDGLCYGQIIPPDLICVCVHTRRVKIRNDFTDTGIPSKSYRKGRNCKWLPISSWDPEAFVPAYPDHPYWPTLNAHSVFPI